MADPLYDLMNAGERNPQMRAWDYLGPNAMSLLQGRPDTRTFPTGAKPGKIPYMEDPRIGGSQLETLMALGAALPMGRAVEGGGMAARAIPELSQSLPGMPAVATPAAATAGGATLASILAGGDEAGAGEQKPFAWTDTNQDRVNRLKALDTQINSLGNRTPSAKNAAVQKVQAQGVQNRIDALNAEKNGILAAQGEERKNAFQVYESEQQKADQEAAAKKSAETSLMDRVPGTRAAIMAVSPYASYKFGKTLGSRMSPAVSVPVAGSIGALSGATSTVGQNEIDLNTLPESSPTYQKASAQMSDPNFWMRTALASGVSGAFGVKGATKGYAGTLPDRTLPNSGQTPPPASPQNMGSSGNAMQEAGGTTPAPVRKSPSSQSGSYSTYTTQSGDKVVQTPHGWQGIHPDTGKWGFVKKPDGPLERLMKGD